MIYNNNSFFQVEKIVNQQSNKKYKLIDVNYEDIFGNNPFSILITDLSQVKKTLNELKYHTDGLEEYFSLFPEKMSETLDKIIILQINQAAIHLFDFPSEYKSKPNIIKELDLEIRIQFLPLIIDIAYNKLFGEFEFFLNASKKTAKNLLLKWNIIENQERTYERVILSFINITESKKIMKALESTEEKFENFVESFNGEIYRCSQDNIIEYANIRAKQNHKEDPIGKKCFDTIFGEKEVCSWCNDEIMFREGNTIKREIFNPKNSKWYQIFINPTYNLEGKFTKSITMLDITTEKKAQSLLSQQTQRLEILNKIYTVQHDSKDISQFFHNILDAAKSTGNYSAGAIIIYNVNNIGKIKAESNMPTPFIEHFGADNFLSLRKFPTFTNQVEHFLETKVILDYNIGSIATIPILSQKSDLGYLILFRSSKKEFSIVEMEFLVTLGIELGIVSQSIKSELKVKNSLLEKELLLKEIHHRVKNNLQIIISLFNLQSRTIKDKKLLNLFQDSKTRIKSMALIHEILYTSENYARIDYEEYIKNLTNNLIRTYNISTKNLNVVFDVEKISIDLNDAIPLALILNEIISNALKYAFPEDYPSKKLFISLKHKEKIIILIVQDNGVGLPKELNIQESKSLGLRLVSMLTKQLHGKLDVDRKKGTQFTIKFKEA